MAVDVDDSAKRLSLRKGMLSQWDCERPVTWGTKTARPLRRAVLVLETGEIGPKRISERLVVPLKNDLLALPAVCGEFFADGGDHVVEAADIGVDVVVLFTGGYGRVGRGLG